jgi:hypothetical protein
MDIRILTVYDAKACLQLDVVPNFEALRHLLAVCGRQIMRAPRPEMLGNETVEGRWSNAFWHYSQQ